MFGDISSPAFGGVSAVQIQIEMVAISKPSDSAAWLAIVCQSCINLYCTYVCTCISITATRHKNSSQTSQNTARKQFEADFPCHC